MQELLSRMGFTNIFLHFPILEVIFGVDFTLAINYSHETPAMASRTEHSALSRPQQTVHWALSRRRRRDNESPSVRPTRLAEHGRHSQQNISLRKVECRVKEGSFALLQNKKTACLVRKEEDERTVGRCSDQEKSSVQNTTEQACCSLVLRR